MAPSDDYRYERKFVVDEMVPQEVEWVLKKHPAAFTEVYPQRWINNIYLDGPDLTSLYANLGGGSPRTKARVRWYGSAFGSITNPMLELKIKRGEVGRKVSFKLASVQLGEGFRARELHDVFRRSDLPAWLVLELGRLSPVLLNRYSRKYFQSTRGGIRITIDTDIRSQGVRGLGNRFAQWSALRALVVVELKYPQDRADEAAKIAQNLPFRLTRSSKYVAGLQWAYPFLTDYVLM